MSGTTTQWNASRLSTRTELVKLFHKGLLGKSMRGIISAVFGVMYVNVGVQHFTNTAWFEPIVPTVLGDPTIWVLITGVMEIAIGIGLILPWTRRYAALSSLVFLVGIYWANLNMWVNNIPLDGKTYAHHWHVLRLVAQLGMMALSYAIWQWNLPAPERTGSSHPVS